MLKRIILLLVIAAVVVVAVVSPSLGQPPEESHKLIPKTVCAETQADEKSPAVGGNCWAQTGK